MSLVPQPSILAAPLQNGRSLTFRLSLESDPAAGLRRLRDVFDQKAMVIGCGEILARSLGHAVEGLRPFPALTGSPYAIPSTQQALWVNLRAEDRGAIFDLSERVIAALAPDFILDDAMDTFSYSGSRDLTGYEDGTANPGVKESVAVAIAGEDIGLAGSSFVTVQRWSHDLARFRAHSPDERDAMIGRRIKDNEEIKDAPECAHVKRTAQELYQPTAFMVRRSLPYATAEDKGLEFIAYCATLDAFERMMKHMAGIDDGVADALFRFSRPITGGYYWCPPLRDSKLDFSALGL